MKSQARRKKFNISFYAAKLHNNPKRGCLESHLNVIKIGLERKYDKLLILEDDAKIIGKLTSIKEPPKDWDMLYLGGTVHRVINRDNKYWPRVMCWTTHAYIINLRNQKLIDSIFNATNYEFEIDRYYLEQIHAKFNAYMCDPMVIIQKEGYSDIENTIVNYDFMQHTLKGLSVPEYEVKNGEYILKLPKSSNDNLPKITIVTPTFNRRALFTIAIRNFEEFLYPKDKIEWVIVDDSSDDDKSVEDLIPIDKRIKYLRLKFKDNVNKNKRISIAQKRNIGVQKASGEIIVHMDDDDYYPPESLLARVKILLKYKDVGIKCVGCTQIGTYDIMQNKSSMTSDGPISFSEASMGYFKSFWNERPFSNTQFKGEHKAFMEGRLENCMDIPYAFIIIAFTHNSNYTSFRKITNNILRFRDTNKEANYYDTWDFETKYFVDELRNYLKKIVLMKRI